MPNLKKFPGGSFEISRSQEYDRWTTRKHSASGHGYRWRHEKEESVGLNGFMKSLTTDTRVNVFLRIKRKCK